jgi:hypothetical protein
MKQKPAVSLRTKYRRIALITLLIFIAVSSVIHFTVGSIIAALKLNGPEAPAVAQQPVTILTISRLEKETPLTPVAIVPRKIVLHSATIPVPQTEPKVTATNHVVVAVSKAPVHGSSKAFSGGPRQQNGGRTSVVLISAPTGYNVQKNVFTNTGSGGDTSGADPSYPGRQVPTGPVWADNGPPGQSATAGGIILGGGGGGAQHPIVIHDSCSPSRGDIIGSY